ncbi:MAG: outer membrane beta-barrel protein, partial [Terriglobia bacterium]
AGTTDPIFGFSNTDCKPGPFNVVESQLIFSVLEPAPVSEFEQSAHVNFLPGFQGGARIGVDVTPHWQVEFTYDYATSNLQFDGPARDQALNLISTSETVARGFLAVQVLDAGEPRGRIITYQWNVNYHFRESGTIVPFVGGGAGFMHFGNGPNFNVVATDVPPTFFIVQTTVSTDSDTAFAFNFGAGVKFYPHRHFGIRLEARNYISFPEFEHTFETLDLGGLFGPPGGQIPTTGTVEQDNTFNHLVLKAGVFVRW